MACGGCGKRVSRILYNAGSAPVPQEDNTLSAARLTPQGWVKTCVKCGAVSDPSPFSENIEKKCSCQIEKS